MRFGDDLSAESDDLSADSDQPKCSRLHRNSVQGIEVGQAVPTEEIERMSKLVERRLCREPAAEQSPQERVLNKRF